jgi:hypothetical protein
MKSIFGKKHAECTEIWEKLFLNDSNPRSSTERSASTGTPWWDNPRLKEFVNGIWYVWDYGLLDTAGY